MARKIMSSNQILRRGGLLCLVILGLTACSSLNLATPPVATSVVPTTTPTPQPSGRGAGDTLRLFSPQAPTILNPHISLGLKDFFASRIVYEPLASFDADERLIPFLAAEIPSRANGGIAADGMSVTWKLKPGVRWSDGQPFTAADVRFTYEFVTNPAVASHAAGSYESVASVDVIDDYTIRVNFTAPNPVWAAPFVGRQGLILPQHVFEPYNGANVREAPANLQPIGTGPYQVVSFRPQEVVFLGYDLVETNKIVYVPNPYFREPDQPYFSRIELRGGGTAIQAARAVLEAGTADLAYGLPASDQELQKIETMEKGHLEKSFGSTVFLIELNGTDPNQGSLLEFPHPFLSDPRVRQAISYAIDRETIATQVFGQFARPTSNMLLAPEQYQSPNTSYEFNLDQAAALLDAAGWIDTNADGIRDQDGVRLRVIYQFAVDPLGEAFAQIVRQGLEAVGFEVQLKRVDPSVLFSSDPSSPDTAEKFAADMQHFFTPNPTPDPAPYLGYWTCGQIPQPENNWSGFNAARWCNPTYDDLLAQSRTELDPEKRRQLFIQMNDLLVEDGFEIPVVHLADVVGVSNDLEGIALTPWDAETWNIKDWRRRSLP